MELVTGLDTQIFVIFLGVVVALGCTLVAFLVDFLKGKNERLREQVLEMTVRQEERARLPQLQMDSVAVISAIAQVGKNLELVVRSAINPAALEAAEPVAEAPIVTEPVFHARPAANLEFAAAPIETPVVVPEPIILPEPIVLAPVAEQVIAVEEVAAPIVAQPLFEEPIAIPAPAEIPFTETPAAEIATPEPDWSIATWREEIPAPVEPLATQEPLAIEETPLEITAPESEQPEVVEATSEPVVTTSYHESLRSLFDTPASLAQASQLEMESRIEEQAPVLEAPVERESEPEIQPEILAEVEQEEPAPVVETSEPVVRIRVLSNNVVSSLEEETEPVQLAPEPEIETPEVLPEIESAPVEVAETQQPVEVEAEAPVMEETFEAPQLETSPEAVEVEPQMEELPVAAPIDFLTAADFGEVAPPEPHESFDSLMAAVNAEPAVVPEEQELIPAEPEDPGVLALPSGMNDRATLDFLKRDKALFTGLIVSIGINDYARLQETSGRPAAEELAKSVSQLVKSLITAPNGAEYFGCRASDDEFIVVFAGENGSVAQRRLNSLSERLWDFQLRSLGNFSVMFSWGATEAVSETFADAVEAASERMRETRHNRRTISMEKTRLKKVVNG